MAGVVTLVNAETGEVVERRTCRECIEVIRRGLLDAAAAYEEVREHQLYKEEGYRSFDAFTREQFGIGRERADQIIVAGRIARELPTNVGSSMNEGQARELAPLRDDPEAMAEVMAEVTEEAEAEGRKPTAKAIREKVTERTREQVITDAIEADPAIQLRGYKSSVLREVEAAHRLVLNDVERVAQSAEVDAQVIDLWESLDRLRESLADWFESLDQHRPSGLRVVNGGKP